MRDGAVSCWGRAMRRRAVRAHGEAAEIAGLRNATSVTAGAGLGCAIDDGRLRCWRFVPQGRVVRAQPPFDVPLGAPVRAVAVGEGLACAAGDAEVWCWRHDRDAPFSPVAIGLARAGAAGAPRSLIAAGSTIWLSNDRGAVWSIADHGRVPMDVSRVRRLDGGDRLARLGHLVCALRDGVVRRCGADPWNPSSGLVERRRLPLANTEELEPPTQLTTPGFEMRPWCRWDTGGRVTCQDPGGTDVAVVGLPPVRAVSAGHRETACAIAIDGRVFCWGSLVREALTDAEVDRGPRMSPRERVPRALDRRPVAAVRQRVGGGREERRRSAAGEVADEDVQRARHDGDRPSALHHHRGYLEVRLHGGHGQRHHPVQHPDSQREEPAGERRRGDHPEPHPRRPPLRHASRAARRVHGRERSAVEAARAKVG
jgi:hypothetical protein